MTPESSFLLPLIFSFIRERALRFLIIQRKEASSKISYFLKNASLHIGEKQEYLLLVQQVHRITGNHHLFICRNDNYLYS